MRRVMAMITAVIILVFSCISVSAVATDDTIVAQNKLSFVMKSGQTVIPDADIAIYRVADEKGLTEQFVNCGVTYDDLCKVTQADSKLLEKYVASQKKLTVFGSAVTDKDGNVNIVGLPNGIYFIKYIQNAAKDKKYQRQVMMQSYLVGFPVIDNEGNVTTSVSCKPKCELTSLAIPTTNISVYKKWEDGNWSSRPKSVKVSLMNGNKVVATVSLSDENNWSYKWEKLQKASYSVKEMAVDANYAVSYKNQDTEFIITNTKVKKTDVQTGIDTNIPIMTVMFVGAVASMVGVVCLILIKTKPLKH